MADFSELETFVAVAGAGSFAGVARRLSLSPAMVGRRIQALEERYGATLIERTTRSHRLTALGEQFLAKARQILETAEELSELSRPDMAQLSGRIRISAPTTLGIKRLAPVIAEMAARYPGVAFELNLSDRTVDLISEGFDLAIRIGELRSSSMVARRIGDYRFVCCAAPSYLKLHGVPEAPGDLERALCVLNLNLNPRNRWPFHNDDGTSFTVGVSGSIEIDNGEAQRAAALAGAGICQFTPCVRLDACREGSPN